LPHLFWLDRDLATDNLVPGVSVYGEKIIDNLRIWDPTRSKLCAALLKGMKVPLVEKMSVLYLGVSSGTTSSHMSDMIRKGIIFGVDFAPRVMRDYYFLCKKRSNLVPILGNANLPGEYAFVPKVDFIYQDVAQPNQSKILLENAKFFLKSKGYALYMIKSRSIDVTQRPDAIFKKETLFLQDNGFEVVSSKNIAPYERDHMALLLRFG